MKKISHLFLVISFFLSFFPGILVLEAKAAIISTIENVAEISYTNEKNELFKQPSNRTITQLDSILGVSGIIPKPALIGSKLSIWNFPAILTNDGKENDQYKLTIQDLISGLESSIYDDKNGNGLIDPEDVIITTTTDLESGKTYNIIISIKDNTGFPNNTVITPFLSVVSLKDPAIIANVRFSVTITDGAVDPEPSSTPTQVPTATPTPGSTPAPEAPKLSVKKTSFPTGRVDTGDVLSYLIEVKNEGTNQANDVFLMDKLPTGLTVLKDSEPPVASNSGFVEYSTDGNTWTTDIKCDETKPDCIRFLRVKWDNVLPLSVVTFFFKVKVGDTGGTIENIAWTLVKIPSSSGGTGGSGISTQTTPVQSFSNLVVNTVKEIYKVGGTVFDKAGKNPVEGVLVELFDKDGKKVGQEITGKTGTYEIEVGAKGI